MSLHSKLQDKNKDLEKQKYLLHESKFRRRKEVALAQVSKNKVVNEMVLMDEWLNKMAEEVSDANRVTNMAMRKACDNTKLAANRLNKLKELKTPVKYADVVWSVSRMQAGGTLLHSNSQISIQICNGQCDCPPQ